MKFYKVYRIFFWKLEYHGLFAGAFEFPNFKFLTFLTFSNMSLFTQPTPLFQAYIRLLF